MSKKLIHVSVLLCAFWLSLPLVHAQKTANTGLKCYVPGKSFQENDDPDCFVFTKVEADLAFARGCWEDAGKLYRAAKLCRNATQVNRNEMNIRIEACSDAAEKELQDERDKAVRQARQAIASNSAYDAQELLRKNDRSSAYRLAKFANDYIAPPDEPNPDCLQAIFDAWQQKAPVTEQKIKAVMPFCYELLHTQDDSVTVRFFEINNKTRLFAFSPKKHELYEWDVPTYKLIKSTVIDSTMREFDISPDGEILVFHSANTFMLLKNGIKKYFSDQKNTDIYCFSSDSKTFFYFDESQMSVITNLIDDVFTPKRDKKNYKTPDINYRKNNLKTNTLPAQLAFGNNHLWLVYRDSIHFYQTSSDKSGRTGWSEYAGIALKFPVDTIPNNPEVSINHHTQTVIQHTYNFLQSSNVKYENGVYSSEKGYNHEGQMVSEQNVWIGVSNYLTTRFFIQRSDSLIQSIHFDEYSTVRWHKGGSLLEQSSTGEWLAISDDEGILRLWRLSGNFSGKYKEIFSSPVTVACSEDGSNFVNCANGKPIELKTGEDLVKTIGTIPSDPDEEDVFAEVSVNGWIACATTSNDTILLFKDKKLSRLSAISGPTCLFRFDKKGQYFACLPQSDSLDIYELSGNEFHHVAGKNFDETISGFCFIPQKDAIVVQRQFYGGEAGTISIPKIWHFKQKGSALQPIKLEKYFTRKIGAGMDGQSIYFTDGASVRILKTDNLTDEKVSIQQRKGVEVTAIEGHPTFPVIAVAYSDGIIACCNTETGKKLFQFAASNQTTDKITRLAFSKSGEQIIAIINNKSIQIFDLAVSNIQNQISLNGGHLVAFAPEQIGQWELDKALEYPGNFKKLADSGDQPMIRSFFNYFSSQAQYSYRMELVQNYCERASDLYELLDEESKKTQRNTLLLMYDDYIWKLIQRNKLEEAATVIRQQNTSARFKSALPLLRTNAHIALLHHDLKTAAGMYLNWFVKLSQENGEDFFDLKEKVGSELQLLNDYGYLDATQRAFVCTFFKHIQALDANLCDGISTDFDIRAVFRDDAAWLRWQIFQASQQIENTYGTAFNSQLAQLSHVMSLAQKLQSLNRSEGKDVVEKYSIKLAELYLQIGNFEAMSTSKEAYPYYTKAIKLLESQGNYTVKNEIYRLSMLGQLYLQRGKSIRYNNPQSAALDYLICFNMAQQMEAKNNQKNYDIFSVFVNLAFSALLQTGKSLMLIGRYPEARVELEKINNLDLPYEFPTANISIAQSYLLENNTTEASLNFGFIQQEEDLATALTEIHQYSSPLKNQPERYRQLQAYSSFLRKTQLNMHPDFDSSRVDFLYYEYMTDYFNYSGQYDSTWVWSQNAVIHYQKECQLLQKNMDLSHLSFERLTTATINLSHSAIFIYYNNAEKLTEALNQALMSIQITGENIYGNTNILNLNIAHLYLLLGDSDKAFESYRAAQQNGIFLDANFLDYLLKDWRDMYKAGIRIEGLKDVAGPFFPDDFPFSEEDLKAIGRR